MHLSACCLTVQNLRAKHAAAQGEPFSSSCRFHILWKCTLHSAALRPPTCKPCVLPKVQSCKVPKVLIHTHRGHYAAQPASPKRWHTPTILSIHDVQPLCRTCQRCHKAPAGPAALLITRRQRCMFCKTLNPKSCDHRSSVSNLHDLHMHDLHTLVAHMHPYS